MPRKRSNRKETGSLQHNGLLYHYVRDIFGRVEVHRHAETIAVFNYDADDADQLKSEARRRIAIRLSGQVQVCYTRQEIAINQCLYNDDYNQDVYPL